jgi:hypothetical protein
MQPPRFQNILRRKKLDGKSYLELTYKIIPSSELKLILIAAFNTKYRNLKEKDYLDETVDVIYTDLTFGSDLICSIADFADHIVILPPDEKKLIDLVGVFNNIFVDYLERVVDSYTRKSAPRR